MLWSLDDITLLRLAQTAWKEFIQCEVTCVF